MTTTEQTKEALVTRDQLVEYENLMRSGDHVSEKGGVDPLHLSMSMEDGGAGGVWDSEFQAFMDSHTLKSLFFSEDWVYIVVDLVALKIASQQLRVMRSEVVDGKEIKKPAEGHQLQELLEQPNPYQAYSAWMYCVVVDLCLGGNAVEWYAGSSNQIMVLPFESVALNLNTAGQLDSYQVMEHSRDGGVTQVARTARFPVDEIIHLRRPNPSSLLWGLSPFIPGRKCVLFNRYSQEYLNSFYQKGAIPGFALSMEKEANERVAMRLLRSFENAYTGRKNMRRTLVLPKGVQVKEMAHTLANQELVLYIDKNRETIINILKVPKHELSLQASGSLGSEEAKTALRNFWASTLIPLMRIIEGEKTKFFLKRGLLAENEFLEFDLDDVDALQEDQGAKADMAKKLLDSGWTLNEVRTKVWELAASDKPEADVPFVIRPQQPAGFGGAPMGLAAPKPAAETAPARLMPAPEGSGEPGLGGPPPPAAGILRVDDDSKDDRPGKVKAARESLTSYLKSGDGWFEKREAKLAGEVAKGTTAMERRTLTLFSDMAAQIVKTVRSHLKDKSWDDIRTKADERSKLVGRQELRRRLRRALDGFEERYVTETRDALVSRMEAGYGAALELPFNLPSASELAAVRARGAAVRQDALEERSGRVFQHLSETTINDVYGTIERGIDEGKTVQAIAEDLRSKFTSIPEIAARAMTIARTETLTAVSLGQAAAMKDAAAVVPDLQKMWLSADDERTRESHRELHGDIVAWDGKFDNGLEFPRDPTGGPDEVINCRCTWLMVPKDQMGEIDAGLIAADETE